MKPLALYFSLVVVLFCNAVQAETLTEAELGSSDPDGQRMLGDKYYIEKNYQEALKWYLLAAKGK
jgi:TPR repeat protein